MNRPDPRQVLLQLQDIASDIALLLEVLFHVRGPWPRDADSCFIPSINRQDLGEAMQHPLYVVFVRP